MYSAAGLRLCIGERIMFWTNTELIQTFFYSKRSDHEKRCNKTNCWKTTTTTTTTTTTNTANWPARQNHAVDRAWRSPVIKYSSAASELGGIVNLVDRRQSSLSCSERPPFSSQVGIGNMFRQWIRRDEICRVRSLGKRPREKVPLFCRYRNFVKTNCTIGRKQPACQKPPRPGQPCTRTPTCDGQTQTDTGP